MMDEKQIVDDIIHYLKLNNAGHIDRDNVFDVLVNYIEHGSESESDRLKDEFEELKKSVRKVIVDLEDLV